MAMRMPRSSATQHMSLPYTKGRWPPAGLPDALVGLLPVVAHPVEHADQGAPAGIGDADADPTGEVDGVHELAIDVELQLVGCPVADAYRP